MNKILLRFAVPMLLAILEPALRSAVTREVKIPDDQRSLLKKLGFGDDKLDAIDARVSAQVADRVMSDVKTALDKATK